MKPRPQPEAVHFLNQLGTQLEQHLSDNSLNVKKLLRIVGMSRANLHRKLNQSAGMSTTGYLRYLRLSRAADLLLDYPSRSICEIAEDVGFNNQSYFTKRFKEVFGATPAMYRVQNGRLKHM